MVEDSLLATLAGLKLSIIHPDGQSARALVASLAQLGCQANYCWPLPAQTPEAIDLLVLAIDPRSHLRLKALTDGLRPAAIPVIALVDLQNTSLFPLLLELKPAAILDKEINPFALMVQIIGALATARQCRALRDALARSQSLTTRRERLAQAKGILMQEHGLDEASAWSLLRREAMNARCSMELTAERVIGRLSSMRQHNALTGS